MTWDHRIVCVDGIYSVYEVYYDDSGRPFGKAQIDLAIDPDWDGTEPIHVVMANLIDDLRLATTKDILVYPRSFDGEMPSLKNSR